MLDFTPSLLMLVSAVLHALGATILKSSAHKHSVRGLSLLIAFLTALCFIPFVPAPTGMTWVFLLTGALIHVFYIHLSIATLERGELGLVYPVMRGLAPVLAAGLGFVVLGEAMSALAITGLVTVTAALILLAGVGGEGGARGTIAGRWITTLRANKTSLLFAVATAATTALYSVNDASGTRSAETAWTYVVWFGVLVQPVCLLTLWWRRRQTFVRGLQQEWRKGLFYSLVAIPGFAIAMYVFSLGPVARLSALRETSVFFAALFAAIFLQEKFGIHRIWLALIICAGLYLMHL